MRTLRITWHELLILRRVLRFWPGALLLPWLALLTLQEPAYLRSAGVPLYWSGVQGALAVMVLMLPLVWMLSRRPGAADWTVLRSRRRIELVAASSLAITIYVLSTAALAILLSLTVDRILGHSVPPVALPLLAQAITLTLPAAALAPGLTYLELPPYLLAISWSGLIVASMVVGLPLPISSALGVENSDPTVAFPHCSALLAAGSATCAGMLFSLATALRRTRS